MQNTRLKKYLARKEELKESATKAVRGTASPKMAAKKRNIGDEQFIIIDMPEVKDIPGQEKIQPPKMREMMDITISSDDEEGVGLLDDLNKEENNELLTSEDSDVSDQEIRLLKKTDRPETEESRDLKKISLDKTDGEDKLNEESDPSDLGSDLDVPGSELDDVEEDIGEEDEENNSYSRRD